MICDRITLVLISSSNTIFVNLLQLQSVIQYQFKNIHFLKEALTHKSANGSETQHERLEYLGDAVLNLAVSQWVFMHFPLNEEGSLSQLRALLVKQKSLCVYAKKLQLARWIRCSSDLGASESLLADTFESVCGAIFCDSDFQTAQSWLLNHFSQNWLELVQIFPTKDWKSQLQEYTQEKWKTLPEYRNIQKKGQDHAPIFQIECAIPQLNLVAQGQGSSKREAEQNAAEILIRKMTS